MKFSSHLLSLNETSKVRYGRTKSLPKDKRKFWTSNKYQGGKTNGIKMMYSNVEIPCGAFAIYRAFQKRLKRSSTSENFTGVQA